MNQDDVEDNADTTGQDSQMGDKGMIHSKGHNADTPTINMEDHDGDSNMIAGDRSNNPNCKPEVNGGINDDNLLEMMAREARTMNTPATKDQIPTGPFGSGETPC